MAGSGSLRRILVDLTPLLPGGDNGGAKPLAIALVRQLSLLAPQVEFTLLCSSASLAGLTQLERSNVRCEAVDAQGAVAEPKSLALAGGRMAARGLVDTLVPARARMRIKDGIWMLVKRWQRTTVTKTARADLVFCPFTAPFFFDPRVPLVSIVHDVQYLAYPSFFEGQQHAFRHQHFLDACRLADRLICVSEFVRQTVLDNSGLPPDRVQTIHSALVHDLQVDPRGRQIADRALDELGVGPRRFLLYPANPWPHKNHRVLIEAFRLYLQEFPVADLALICTGAPGRAAEEVVALASSVLPTGRFAFAGFLPEREFICLLQQCRALIFPSLYEGFGLPVLEAMACGRPVLCSNVTSLPSVAGDAALLFDPLDPFAIAGAIARLEADAGLEARLVQRGPQRAASFGTARDMAANYLAAFEAVVAARAG